MQDWIRSVADLGARYGCRILVYNNLSGLFDTRLVFVEESGRQFFSLQNEPLESPFNQMVKRLFDLAISIPALIFYTSNLHDCCEVFPIISIEWTTFF